MAAAAKKKKKKKKKRKKRIPHFTKGNRQTPGP